MEVSYAQAQLLRPVWSEKFLGCGTPDRRIVCLLHCALASGAVYCCCHKKRVQLSHKHAVSKKTCTKNHTTL